MWSERGRSWRNMNHFNAWPCCMQSQSRRSVKSTEVSEKEKYQCATSVGTDRYFMKRIVSVALWLWIHLNQCQIAVVKTRFLVCDWFARCPCLVTDKKQMLVKSRRLVWLAFISSFWNSCIDDDRRRTGRGRRQLGVESSRHWLIRREMPSRQRRRPHRRCHAASRRRTRWKANSFQSRHYQFRADFYPPRTKWLKNKTHSISI